jgi:hypothetical protein
MSLKPLCLVIVVMASLFVAAPADAGTAGCVTRHEFYSVHQGQTKAHVQRLWGSGRLAWSRQTTMRRMYKICGVRGYNVAAKYHLRGGGVWRLASKWANAE